MAAGKELFRKSITAASRAYHISSAGRATRIPLLNRPQTLCQTPSCIAQSHLSRAALQISSRHNYTTTRAPKPLTDSKPATDDEATQNQIRRDQEPSYLIYFTCKPCSHRSSHHISKHGYHKGTVLITCPSCDNRHVISDHLKIFMDAPVTLEDILAEKGTKVTKGTMKGDMEWWDKPESEENSAAATSTQQIGEKKE